MEELQENTKQDDVTKIESLKTILNKIANEESLTAEEKYIYTEYTIDILNNKINTNKDIGAYIIEKTLMPKFSNEYMNNTKIANTITSTQNIIGTEEHPINLEVCVMPKLNVVTLVDLLADSHLQIDSNINITYYDMAVMDAVYTLAKCNCTVFTPQMVCKVMSGNMKQRITAKKTEKLVRSLNKLKQIQITIDCSKEVSVRQKGGTENKVLLNSYLLPLEKLEVKSGVHTNVLGYRLIKMPALYEYAERVNQIITIPIKLLSIQDDMSDNDEVILIKRYIIKRIALMKNDKNNITSRKISLVWYDVNNDKEKGLYAELGYKEEDYENWKAKKRRIRTIVEKILKALKEQGDIKDFKIYRNQGVEIKGYEIFLE